MQEREILNIPPYLRHYFSEDSQFHYYESYKKNISSYRQIENRFICLKGFSSSTPIINSVAFDSNSMGGGFFFQFHGLGIAVDPGIGFTSLMHKNGIFIDDIDVVIVTHPHIDHNCDVSALASLLFDFNRNRENQAKVCTDFLYRPNIQKHNIEWFLDDVTIKSNEDDLDKEHIHHLKDCVFQAYPLLDEDHAFISLSSIHTQHIKDSTDSFGIKFSFQLEEKNIAWGYTSDTAYFEGLCSFFNDCDVMIMNISDVYISDVVHAKQKRSHLGFTGCDKLISAIRPNLVLVSEFCCTNGDYRFEIVRALREKHNSEDICIIPAEIGCNIGIIEQNVRCSYCGKQSETKHLKVIHPEIEFGRIRYLCQDCIL